MSKIKAYVNSVDEITHGAYEKYEFIRKYEKMVVHSSHTREQRYYLT